MCCCFQGLVRSYYSVFRISTQQLFSEYKFNIAFIHTISHANNLADGRNSAQLKNTNPKGMSVVPFLYIRSAYIKPTSLPIHDLSCWMSRTLNLMHLFKFLYIFPDMHHILVVPSYMLFLSTIAAHTSY